MFRITYGKGFNITFPNGWSVSVQFGPGNYCDHYDAKAGREELACGQRGSTTAECAVIHNRSLFPHPSFEGNTVGGYMNPEQVLELMNWAASQGTDSNSPKRRCKGDPNA